VTSGAGLLDGGAFSGVHGRRLAARPTLLLVAVIGVADVLVLVDSIPAVFGLQWVIDAYTVGPAADMRTARSTRAGRGERGARRTSHSAHGLSCSVDRQIQSLYRI
jgi:hypothetical protein